MHKIRALWRISRKTTLLLRKKYKFLILKNKKMGEITGRSHKSRVPLSFYHCQAVFFHKVIHRCTAFPYNPLQSLI